MTFEPGRSDDRPDVLITLDDLAAAETAIRRLERVVATRRRRLREKEESLDVLRSQRRAAPLAARCAGHGLRAAGGDVMEDPMILTTITPESVALKHAQQPYRLRCLTESCYLATQTLGSRFIDVLDAPGELHARGTGHHVAIERVEEGQGMTFEPGRSDDRPDALITLDDLAAAETAIRRLERVVATRRSVEASSLYLALEASVLRGAANPRDR